jgi:hypothetical protein
MLRLWRKSVRIVVPLFLSSTFAACAIHPLTQDVTGYRTIEIVQKIRCEARDAVIAAQVMHFPKVDFSRHRILAMRAKRAAKQQITAKELKEINFVNSGIVMAFALEGSETNGVSFAADIVKPLAHGTETLSIPAVGQTLLRDNIRAFTISDTFGGLMNNLSDSDCNFESGPNYEYPIVGTIGVKEMVRSFIALALTGDLGVDQDSSKPPTYNPTGLPSMADTITFTTTLTGGVTPKIVLTPVGQAVQLMDASLGLTAMRVDHDQVTIGLALPAPATNPKQVAKFIPTFSSQNISGTGVGAAAEAVSQQILRFELPTPAIVAP